MNVSCKSNVGEGKSIFDHSMPILNTVRQYCIQNMCATCVLLDLGVQEPP